MKKKTAFDERIVAVHIEDTVTRIDMQVEHTVATTFQGTADRRVDHQLESGIVLHIESHRNIHRAACGFLLRPCCWKSSFLRTR